MRFDIPKEMHKEITEHIRSTFDHIDYETSYKNMADKRFTYWKPLSNKLITETKSDLRTIEYYNIENKVLLIISEFIDPFDREYKRETAEYSEILENAAKYPKEVVEFVEKHR